MDKSKHKIGKKMEKNTGKEKSPLFVSDVKNLKENLKIKEILRTVKMNSSMRLKSPQNSKAVNNKDVDDHHDCFQSSQEPQDHMVDQSNPSATNHNVITSTLSVYTETSDNDLQKNKGIEVTIYEVSDTCTESNHNSPSYMISENCNNLKESEINEENTEANNNPTDETSSPKSNNSIATLKPRDRKLSLDQTILSRRSGLSQSELDLNLIGKSPLERKSSFFRKKMDNFLKNTTEIFKRQSQNIKEQPRQRRGSKSISLQSLNDKSYPSNGYNEGTLQIAQEIRNSATSLTTMARSSSMASSISPEGAEQESLSGSQTVLFTSQPLGDFSSNSVNNLNESYAQDSLLKSRAISMSSGLDAPQGRLRRKASKSNRVTWLASEGLTNYFKQVMQDEKSREVQSCHSYQDFSSIPEHASYGPTTDSKGRRLSYQRAVSGEDPVLPTRYFDSSQRRKNFIPEHQVPNFELEAKLNDFTLYGVSALHGFTAVTISEQALEFLHWAERRDEMQQYYENCNLPPLEESRQAVIRELVNTEADYIRHLKSLVEVFMAAAHALQESSLMLEVDTQRLFSNIPDLYNASLVFWNATFYPMILDSIETGGPLKPELMREGFHNIDEYFQPYETYLMDQSKAVEYLRTLANNAEFMTYLSWCHKQKEINRLQLADMLAKPMQRITKYSLIINRISHYTEKDNMRDLINSMETNVKSFVLHINRCIRQREEKDKITTMANLIDAYELEFKDEEMERCFALYTQLDLYAPMIHVLHDINRCMVFSGDLRFKDNTNKEIDVRVHLFTDMMLICKKMPKGSPYMYKMIRPKYMLDRLHYYPKHSRGTKDVVALIFVAVDDFHSSYHSFTLSEPSKEEKTQIPLKTSLLQIWDQKIKEAKISYELVIIYGHQKEGVADSAETSLKLRKMTPEEIAIEKEAREWAAIMMHGRMTRDEEYAMMNIPEDTFQITEAILAGNIDAARRWRNPVLRRYSSTTVGSSRTSRLSSLQKSISATSRDEPLPGTSKGLYCLSDSIEIPFEILESEDTYNDEISDDEDAESPLPSSMLPPPYLSPQISRPPVLQSPALQQSVIRPEVIHQLALQPSMIQEAIIRGLTIQEPIMPLSISEEEIPSLVVEPLNEPPAIVEPVRVSIVEGPPMRRVGISNPVVQSTANRVHCNPKPPSELEITQQSNNQQLITQQSMAVGIPVPIQVPFALLPSLRGDAAVRSHDAEGSKAKKGRSIPVPRAKSVQSSRSAQIQHVQRSKSVQSAHSSQFLQYAERTQSITSDYSAKSIQSERVGHRKNGRGRRGKRAASASPSTLRVVPPDDEMASMLSLPDLTVEPPTPRHPPSPQSASEQMYQTHLEQLQRNRVAAQQQHFLSPDHRGSSYPPTSPSRHDYFY